MTYVISIPKHTFSLSHFISIRIYVHDRLALVTGIDKSVRLIFTGGHGNDHITDGHHISVCGIVEILGLAAQVGVFKRKRGYGIGGLYDFVIPVAADCLAKCDILDMTLNA